MKNIILFLIVGGSVATSFCSFDHIRKIAPESEDFWSFEEDFKATQYSLIRPLHKKVIVRQRDLVAVVSSLYDSIDLKLFLRKSKFTKNAEALMRSGEVCDFNKMTENPEWYQIKNLGQLEMVQLDGTTVVHIFSKS
jgi:hypothetical protein